MREHRFPILMDFPIQKIKYRGKNENVCVIAFLEVVRVIHGYLIMADANCVPNKQLISKFKHY